MYTSGPYIVIASTTTEHQSDIISDPASRQVAAAPELRSCRRQTDLLRMSNDRNCKSFRPNNRIQSTLVEKQFNMESETSRQTAALLDTLHVLWNWATVATCKGYFHSQLWNNKHKIARAKSSVLADAAQQFLLSLLEICLLTLQSQVEEGTGAIWIQ